MPNQWPRSWKQKTIHPNDDINMSQSSNDSFPSAMYMAAAIETKKQLLPALKNLTHSLDEKSKLWADVIKIGRTHLQDATPLTVGQELSGYVGMLNEDIERIEIALVDV